MKLVPSIRLPPLLSGRKNIISRFGAVTYSPDV